MVGLSGYTERRSYRFAWLSTSPEDPGDLLQLKLVCSVMVRLLQIPKLTRLVTRGAITVWFVFQVDTERRIWLWVSVLEMSVFISGTDCVNLAVGNYLSQGNNSISLKTVY